MVSFMPKPYYRRETFAKSTNPRRSSGFQHREPTRGVELSNFGTDLLSCRGCSQWLFSTTMARIAGDVRLAIGELRVDLFGHGEHFARHQFRRLLVAGPVVHMAI